MAATSPQMGMSLRSSFGHVCLAKQQEQQRVDGGWTVRPSFHSHLHFFLGHPYHPYRSRHRQSSHSNSVSTLAICTWN